MPHTLLHNSHVPPKTRSNNSRHCLLLDQIKPYPAKHLVALSGLRVK